MRLQGSIGVKRLSQNTQISIASGKLDKLPGRIKHRASSF